MGDELNLSASTLGSIGAIYLVTYTIGQFVAGIIGNCKGPRILLLAGMAISIFCNVAFGLANSPEMVMVFMAINGLAQATGWSGTVGTMANWFHRAERGTVMGFWSTNFQIGGVLANGIAAWVLGAYGFRYSFFAGSLVLLGVWAFFIFNQRDKPEDLGLPPVLSPEELELSSIQGENQSGAEDKIWSRAALINVLLIGTFYFFVKFIRYAIWSWAPFFLAKNYHLEGAGAGYLSTLFDLFGVVGTIAIGILSDRLFQGRRAGISLIMISVMFVSCLLMYFLGSVSVTFFAVAISLVGFSLYGPDALLSGAGAMDIGSRRGATLAAGIINGMGSIGSVVQEVVIGKLYERTGGNLDPIFLILVGSSLAALFLIGVVHLRNRFGYSNV